jgi:hypothetical protein
MYRDVQLHFYLSVQMMMRTLLASLFVLVLAMNVSMAADDPMKSLFMFQQQMAEGGNSAAMMKLGEMYEKGEGTPRNLDKAREMYQQAKAKGHPKADAALNRLNKQQPRSAQKSNAAQEQARKEAEAKRQAAERERARQAELERQKSAQQKAAQESAAQQKAAQERAAQQKAAQERAAQQKAAQERAAQQKAAQQKAAKEKAKREALARQQQEEAARRAAQQKAAQERAAQQKLAQQKAAQEAAARKQTEEDKKQVEKKGFKSDPCQGAAARVMSTCKK